jgi:periplasmic protein CpxP/Spy
MKTVLSIITLLLVVFATAQDAPKMKQHKRGEHIKDFTPEQMAILQTKRMALDLELNDRQQKEILKLNTKLADERMQKIEQMKARKEKGGSISKEERFTLMNEQLDKKIELQQQMKTILNEKQFEQWKKYQGQRKKMQHSRMMNRRDKMMKNPNDN